MRGTLFFTCLLLLHVPRAASQEQWAAPVRLNTPIANPSDLFGGAVALSGDGLTLAVGAEREDSNSSANPGSNDATEAGAVYIFVRQGVSDWMMWQYLKAPTPRADARFGISLDLSADGSVLVVGALGSGEAFTFYRSGPMAPYSDVDTLVPDPSSQFGITVSVSPDGTLVAVGDDTLGGRGAVWLYRNLGTSYNLTYTIIPDGLPASSLFGRSICVVDNTTVAVGGPYPAGEGAVYLFTLDGPDWNMTHTFTASNAAAGAFFGYSVAMSSARGTLIVGAYQDAAATGAAYIFEYNGTHWVEQALIFASNPDAGDWFGFSVDISSDGNTVMVGAINEASGTGGINPPTRDNANVGSGAVYVLKRNASLAWVETDLLKATEMASSIELGTSVSISDDGDVFATGVPRDNRAGMDTGAAYVYQRFTPGAPSVSPTAAPSAAPTPSPSVTPTAASSVSPTASPSAAPTPAPSESLTTASPTLSPVLPGGTIINGSAIVTTPLQVVDGVLTVNGDLELQQGSNLTLSNDASIVSTGTVVVSGPLTLELEDAPVDGQTIQLVSGSSVSGTFEMITLQSNNLDPCKNVNIVQQNPNGNSLTALVSVDSSGCANIPLIVGATVGGVLLVGAIIAIGGAMWHKRQNARVLSRLDTAMQRVN